MECNDDLNLISHNFLLPLNVLYSIINVIITEIKYINVIQLMSICASQYEYMKKLFSHIQST